MILIIDNTKNIEQAKMTPKIIKIMDVMAVAYYIVSSKKELLCLIQNKSKKESIHGIILSGGPLCLSDGCYYRDISKNIIALTVFKDTPILGICFGFQVMCDVYGGEISKLDTKNYGLQLIDLSNNNLFLLKTMKEKNPNSIMFSHYDYVKRAPVGFNVLYSSSGKAVIGIENLDQKKFGFQFHPEGSEDGIQIIRNFIYYCRYYNF